MFSQLKRSAIFSVFVALLFLVRGLGIQCLYPPLEGPDEYQHIAYLAYLKEHHALPTFDKATVPKSMYPDLVANPHCIYDCKETGKIGCLDYSEFYERGPQAPGAATIGLYEAQQAPLYYVLFAPVYGWVKEAFGFRQAIYTLRSINIALAALGIVLLASPLRGVFRDESLIRLGILAVSLLPMFMTYVSRVSCDALAMAFAGLAVHGLTRMNSHRHLPLNAAIVGGLIGLGVLTKLIVICLLPVTLLFITYLALMAKLPRRDAVVCAVAVIGGYLLFAGYYHCQNYHRYGTSVAYNETIWNTGASKTPFDVARQIQLKQIRFVFLDVLMRSNLWTSGGSFLFPCPFLASAYRRLLDIALLGVVPGLVMFLFRSRATGRMPVPPNLVLCGLITVSAFLMVYGQCLNSIVLYGYMVTLPYYVMIGYPAFLICILAAARGYGRGGALTASLAMIILFLSVEYYCVLGVAVEHWANAADPRVIYRRLASVHPVFPSPAFYLPMAVIVCFMATVLLRASFVARDPVPLAGGARGETAPGSDGRQIDAQLSDSPAARLD
jgi:hypothetical protein